jgi:hypothetical protein
VTLPSAHEVLRAADLLRDVAVKHGIRLSMLVAETSLWANPEVHRRLSMESSGGAYFPDRRRCRLGQGESPGQRIGALVLDNNSYANVAIKRALGVEPQQVVGFEACHIWPLTCYNERYHTLIANLVLLPRALAGLTDHDPDVQAALQYRAFDLYGWHPAEAPTPQKPSDYPDEWRAPMPFADAVARSLAKRTLRRLPEADSGAPSDVVAGGAATARDYTRYDVQFGARTYSGLPKRVAILTVVRALIDSGVAPSEIEGALPSLASRLFRSADGQLASVEFVAAVSALRAAQGKPFDAIRYFCADDELIQHGGRTYALSSQWGGWTQDALDTLLKTFLDRGVSATRRVAGAAAL